jgi:formate hydrogenlyase transcriptional activator
LAQFLLDIEGHIVTWSPGAARIYLFSEDQAVGKHVSALYFMDEQNGSEPQRELTRSAAEGHFGNEGWHVRKDGARFWANVITLALRDERGELQGFARIVRDFSERHERDEKLRHSRARVRPIPLRSTIAGMVSGEFNRIPEANDAFLNIVGYSREDLLNGSLRWPDLTPPEYAALDDLAHEEALRFGACTGGQLLFVGQVHLVGTNLLGAQYFW